MLTTFGVVLHAGQLEISSYHDAQVTSRTATPQRHQLVLDRPTVTGSCSSGKEALPLSEILLLVRSFWESFDERETLIRVAIALRSFLLCLSAT